MEGHILCIEDEDGVRTGVRMVLETIGLDVEEASNGRDGLAKALRRPPLLVLCDIAMPELDGYETLEQFKSRPSLANIPFLFLTAEDSRRALRKGMNLGANDFILKPFSADDLIKAVQVRLDELQRRAQETKKEMERLSENISRAMPHELRTPMTGILGIAELLSMQGDQMAPDEVKELSRGLYASAERLNATLEKFWLYTQCQILAYHQAELDASRAEGVHNAGLVIERMALKVAETFDRSKDLSVYASPFGLAIAGYYLEVIIREVLDNAFKFSPAGREVSIRCTVHDQWGLIIISDLGRGLTPQQLRNVNAFFQFDREVFEQQGLGLGLVISKRLTELHGGTFVVESKPEHGTIVTIQLPLTPNA